MTTTPRKTKLTERQQDMLEEMNEEWAEEMKWAVMLIALYLQEGKDHSERFTFFERRYHIQSNAAAKRIEIYQLDC